MIAIGIDPSLTSTGLALWDGERFRTASFPSRPKPKANLLEQHDRVDAIHSRVRDRLEEWDVDLLLSAPFGATGPSVIAIEELPKSKMLGRSLDRTAHLWRLVDTVRFHLPVPPTAAIEVNPTSLKKIATGYGKAEKSDMLAAALAQFGVECRTDDEADAVHLAAVAAAVAGHPIPGWLGVATPDRAKSFELSQAAYDAATAG